MEDVREWGMRLSATQTASDTFAAVAPETRTVAFSSKRLIREWAPGGDDQNPLPGSSWGNSGPLRGMPEPFGLCRGAVGTLPVWRG